MKQSKQRVIAIDYFRGVCILVVLLSHSSLFSKPFAYISGLGILWTSAAEIFFLLSGITFAIVRGKSTVNNFKEVLVKSWQRARYIYILSIIASMASLVMALIFVSHNATNYVPGDFPTSNANVFSVLFKILNLTYMIGWASFLKYYAIYLLAAPFMIKLLYTRLWSLVPITSISLYLVETIINPAHTGGYYWFSVWQVYFFVGMALARFRLPILGYFYGLHQTVRRLLTAGILTVGISTLTISVLNEFNIYPYVSKLVLDGWLPAKAQGAYIHLLKIKPSLDMLFTNNRAAPLRPLVALLALATAYLIYQRYKDVLLRRTGRFINNIGKDTLWIFVAQSIAIPLLSALPLPHNLATSILLTSTLITTMWLVTQRRVMAERCMAYLSSLKKDFYEAKYAVIYKSQDNY